MDDWRLDTKVQAYAIACEKAYWVARLIVNLSRSLLIILISSERNEPSKPFSLVRTRGTYEGLSPTGEVIASRELPRLLSGRHICGVATKEGKVILRVSGRGDLYEFDPATAEFSALPSQLPSGWIGCSFGTVPASASASASEEYVASTTKGVAKLDPVAG